MNVSFWIASLPLWLAALLVIALPSLLALLGPVLIRRKISLERLAANNEVAGFKYATVAVSYVVLLAFVVIIAWESYKDAEEFTHREAAALVTIYRLAGGLPEATRRTVREHVLAYTQSVIDEEWPALAEGKASTQEATAYNRMFEAVLAVEPATEAHKAIYQSILDSLVRINEHRSELIISAEVSLPLVLWYTLIVGGLVTVGFTYFFGSPNVWVQAVQVGVLAAMIALTLLLIAKMDYPFTGDVRIPPDAFVAAAGSMRELGASGVTAPARPR